MHISVLSMCPSSIPDVCTQMPTRPYTVVVRRADEVLYVAAGVAPLVRIRFSADSFLLFFAVVVQVLPAPSDPRPRGSVAAYMVCVGFADLYLCPCVYGSGSIGRRFQWARINGLAGRMKDKIRRHVLSLSCDFCSAF